MFWNGTHWVDPRSELPPRVRGRRLTDVLATIPILLLLPALLSPFLRAEAASPSLHVSGIATPGSQLAVAGSAFPTRYSLMILWDGSATGMPTLRTSTAGTFVQAITVPASAQIGQHLIAVTSTKKGGGGSSKNVSANITTVYASQAVMVGLDAGSSPNPTAEPTLAPTFDPTAGPSLAPTAGPTVDPTFGQPPAPTAAPTFQPTFDPTAPPTVAPTSAPTPGPTVAPTAAPTPTATPTNPPGPVMTIEDNFDGTALRSWWKPLFGPGDPGDRFDTDMMGDLRQVSVANSIATITVARKATPSGRAFAGATMATYGTFGQKYGTWAARVRYDEAKGTWPSWFLLPVGQKGPYPEIDVFEAYGDPACLGPGAVTQAAHYAGETTSDYKVVPLANSSGWHVWKIVWTATRLDFYIDGSLTHSVTNVAHVPQVAMYPIFVFGVGANNPDCRADASTPDVMTMDVDYIRVFAP
jgi:Glycosyl hydrolases family 16